MAEVDDDRLRHVIHSLAGDEGFSQSMVQLLRDEEPDTERLAKYMECRALWAREMQMELRGATEAARALYEERQALARLMRDA